MNENDVDADVKVAIFVCIIDEDAELKEDGDSSLDNLFFLLFILN